MPSNGRLPVDAFKWKPSTAWFKSLDKWSLFGTHYSCPGYITYWVWSCFTACLTLSPLNAASRHENLAVNLTVGTSLWVSVDVLLWVLLYGYGYLTVGIFLWKYLSMSNIEYLAMSIYGHPTATPGTHCPIVFSLEFLLFSVINAFHEFVVRPEDNVLLSVQ